MNKMVEHDWRTCTNKECEECQSLVDYGIVMGCDGCGSPGHVDCDAWNLTSDGRVLCDTCMQKRE